MTLVEILNDDMPFLVDSVLGELQDFGADVRFVTHPIISVERDKRGRLRRYLGTEPAPPPAIRESLIHVHIGRIALASDRQTLAERLDEVLTLVRRAVVDWHAMVARVSRAIADYTSRPPAIASDEVNEAIAFLEWLSPTTSPSSASASTTLSAVRVAANSSGAASRASASSATPRSASSGEAPPRSPPRRRSASSCCGRSR